MSKSLLASMLHCVRWGGPQKAHFGNLGFTRESGVHEMQITPKIGNGCFVSCLQLEFYALSKGHSGLTPFLEVKIAAQAEYLFRKGSDIVHFIVGSHYRENVSFHFSPCVRYCGLAITPATAAGYPAQPKLTCRTRNQTWMLPMTQTVYHNNARFFRSFNRSPKTINTGKHIIRKRL